MPLGAVCAADWGGLNIKLCKQSFSAATSASARFRKKPQQRGRPTLSNKVGMPLGLSAQQTGVRYQALQAKLQRRDIRVSKVSPKPQQRCRPTLCNKGGMPLGAVCAADWGSDSGHRPVC